MSGGKLIIAALDLLASLKNLSARGPPGGGDRTRTDDPLLAKQVLSQLSYTPGTGELGDRSASTGGPG